MGLNLVYVNCEPPFHNELACPDAGAKLQQARDAESARLTARGAWTFENLQLVVLLPTVHDASKIFGIYTKLLNCEPLKSTENKSYTWC
jgi:hypothetical protein